MKKYYFFGSLLILFFFLRGGEFLFSRFDSNLAYVFDQLSLAVIGAIAAFVWLKKKKYFSIGKVVPLLIILFVVLAHYNSFYRVFWFDELRNIIFTLATYHGHQGALSSALPPRPNMMWEKYGWGYSTLVYELVGLSHTYSLFFWSASGILLLVLASLSVAFLAGNISKSRLAALIAGLLIGVTPSSFFSLLWITNIQTDGLGVILVALTVCTWFVARKTKDAKGVLIALLLLAASLKGGSVVRTATTAGILMLTDIIFFGDLIKKKRLWKDWLSAIVISLAFYFSNPAVQWAGNVRDPGMTFVVRLSFLAEATTKSLFPPLLLIPLVNYLNPARALLQFPWVVTLGAGFFLIGSLFALITFLKFRPSYFTWGWIWFYTYIWYIPWLGELHKMPDDNLGNYVNFAGYEFAYLSMVGLYIAIAIILSKGILKKGIVGLLVTVLTLGVLIYRLGAFLTLDSHWRNEFTNQTRLWYQYVFTKFPTPTGYFEKDESYPKVLVELDKEHIKQEANLFMPLIYYDKSVLFYSDADLFYKEAVLEKKIPIDRIYAIKWDTYYKREVDLTVPFREFLTKAQSEQSTVLDLSSFTNQ